MSAPAHYDVAIIGAGINGAGIARDAALRGLRVVVLDKSDMCSGTSAVSSRLIHGGLRYLEYAEIPLVYESLHERRCLRHIARHLVKPLRISIPIFDGARRGPLLIRLGMIAYDVLSFNKRLPRHDMLARDDIRHQEPGLCDQGLRGAARYYDAQITFAERLVLENLLAARSAGASIKTYCEVQKISVHEGQVNALRYTDRQQIEHEIRVDSVVNASGPWVDAVLKRASRAPKRLVGGTKGSHIVVSHFNGAPKDAFYVEAQSDGRPFFIIPWNKQYLIGTTDIRYDASLDTIRASGAEVAYLIAETNRVFPAANLGAADVNFAYAGVRPLPYRKKGPESAITRRHIIKVNRSIATGLISIIGGKLTTYRNLGEQTIDRLAKLLRRRLPACRTRDTVLPGAWGIDRARVQLMDSGIIEQSAVQRLLSIYGGRSLGILEIARLEPTLAKPLDAAQQYLRAEVAFAVREEFATTLVDVIFRRMMVGYDADQGRSLYTAIASQAAKEFSWSADELQHELKALTDFADSLCVSAC